MNHEKYMKRCIELAKLATGNTYPNPLVGSVIVHEGKIIGEGYHRKAGERHAEINAINSVEDASLLPDSVIYVSLEPCAHFGRTPPCATRLAEIGFSKVIIGSVDPHEKVSGKGIKILEDAGIEVITGVLRKECDALNVRFFTSHLYKRPYIILKWAESSDGFLDSNFLPHKISNGLVNQIVHKMRAEEHGILVGTNTAVKDNPSLTTRNIEGRNPVRIVIDLDLKVPADNLIFDGEAETIILTSAHSLPDDRQNLRYVQIEKQFSIQSLLQKLHEQNIQSVLVEGGAFTLSKFIEENIWDEAYIISNSELKVMNGTAAPALKVEPESINYVRGNKVKHYRNTTSQGFHG